MVPCLHYVYSEIIRLKGENHVNLLCFGFFFNRWGCTGFTARTLNHIACVRVWVFEHHH